MIASYIGIMVIYTSFRGGIANGLINSAIGLLYYIGLFSDGQFLIGLNEAERQDLLDVSVVFPLVAVMVGILHIRDVQKAERLLAVEARYRSIFENAIEGIYQTAPDGRLLLANPTLAKITGYNSPDELLRAVNKGDYQIYVDPTRRQEFRHKIEKQGYIHGFESQVARADGSIIWISETARTVRDESGVVRYYEGFVYDITNRKQAEKSLGREREFTTELIGSTQDGIVAVDRSLRYTVWNPAMERITGLAAADVVDKTLAEVFPNGLMSDIEGHYRRALHGEALAVSAHEFYIPATGKLGYLESQFSPIKDSEGLIRGALWVAHDVTERQEAEERLERQNRYLRALQQMGVELSREHDPDRLLSKILKLTVDLLGSLHGYLQLMDTDSEDIVTKVGLGEFSSAVGQRLKRGEGLGGKVWEEGRPIVVEDYQTWPYRQATVAKVVPNVRAKIAVPLVSNGSVVGVLGVAYDKPGLRYIEEKLKLLEQAARMSAITIRNAQLYSDLETSNRRLEEAQRLARIGSWEWNVTSDTVIWSDEVYRIYGLQKGKFQPNYANFLDHVHPDDRSRVDGIIREVLANKQDAKFEHRVVRSDGTVRHLEARAQALVDPDGNPYRLRGTSNDITDRRLAEEVLRQSESRYRALAENAHDAIISTNDSGIITYVNLPAQRIFGYRPAEMLSKSLEIVVPGEGQGLTGSNGISRYLSSVGTKLSDNNFEIICKHKSGGSFPAEISLASWQSGGSMQHTLIVRDISDRKRLDQMRSDFVAVVSHQLKTPMALIRGYADNMLTGITGPLNDRQKKYLTEMTEIAANNYHMISDLLNLSRLERGVISVDIKPQRLRDVIESGLRDHVQAIADKGLQLDLSGVDQTVMVKADAFKLAEAIRNVVDNAVRFTDKGGAITMRTEQANSLVRLDIKDTGTGMDQAAQSVLFTRDQVLSGSPQPDTSTGLGLYISRQFMRLQGGDIEVSSKRGQGSTFTLWLPVAKVEARKAGGNARAKTSYDTDR